jgi:hypothetical protein
MSQKNRVLLTVLLGLAPLAPARAASTFDVTIDWDAVTMTDTGTALTNLAGYRLFQTTSSLLGMTTSQASIDPQVGVFLAAASTTSFHVAGLFPGTSYQFRLTAFDATGQQSDFNVDLNTSLDVEISTFAPGTDITPPTIAISSPVTGAYLAGVVTLRAAASDDVAVASVQFLVDDSTVGAVIFAAPFNLAWNTGGLNGVHKISAQAVDSSGNRATAAAVYVTIPRTVVMLTHATNGTSANLAVESTDPAFPSTASVSAQISLPSGVKSVVLSKLNTSIVTFSASYPGATFSPIDFSALDGSSVTVTIGTQTFLAVGAGNTIVPTVGGLINDFGGTASKVVVAGNGINLDAQILISPMAADVRGLRAAAAARQHLRLLGTGMDIIFHSSSTLNQATLTLPYDATLIPPYANVNRVAMAYFNASTNMWEIVNNVTLGNGVLSARVTHFSPYAPVLQQYDATPYLRDVYAFPNPAIGGQTPIIRVMPGIVDSIDISIFDAAGRKINSTTMGGSPTGTTTGGEYYYDYHWTASKASGIYFAVIHAHALDGTTIKGRTKLAVIK